MSSTNAYTGTPSTPLEPTQTTTIEQALKLFAKSLRKCMPAQIVAVNGANFVDVKPGNMARFATLPEAVDLPLLSQVPVVQPQGANFSIQLPIAVGDTGMLLFADRCIDRWLAGDGSPRDPQDPRLHHLTDAIFVPGLLTSDASANQTPFGTDLVLRNGAAHLHVQASGTYRIRNEQAELLSALSSLCSQLTAIVSALAGLQGTGVGTVQLGTPNPNAGGALTPIGTTFSSLGPLALGLESVARQIDSLKGS